MISQSWLFPSAGAAAGLALGLVLARSSINHSAEAALSADRMLSNAGAFSSEGDDKSPPLSSRVSPSDDTAESLIGSDPKGLYGRLALWLLDASTEEIGQYWEYHIKEENPSREISDLIMIGWTSKDPLGAIAAVKDTKWEQFPWWAWASHDPELALSSAHKIDKERTRWVGWGLGEFHPKWTRENYETLPSSAKDWALGGTLKWPESDDPMATMEFAQKHGHMPHSGMIRLLIRQDARQAFEWWQKSYDSFDTRFARDRSGRDFLATLAKEDPGVLDQLIDEQPAGERRRKMEAAAFSQLIKDDSDAAWERAQAQKAPMIQAHQKALVAMGILRENPERAFEIAESMIEVSLDQASRENSQFGIYTDSTANGEFSGPRELLHQLAMRDPERMMNFFKEMPEAEASEESNSFNSSRMHSMQNVSRIWARRDVEGFAQWAIDQDDPVIMQHAAPSIAGALTNQGRYESALEWATISGSQNQGAIATLRAWYQNAPGQARYWFDHADLDTRQRENLKQIFANQP